MVGEISQLQEDFQPYANWGSKYPAVTLAGYVSEGHMVFHKICQFLTEGGSGKPNWFLSYHIFAHLGHHQL